MTFENKNKMDVVISKYKEDIKWSHNLSNLNIKIYNKSDEYNEDFIHLKNIGREAHTYLTHIVNNYDNLSDYTCFLQGNPFDHLNVSLDKLIDVIKSNEDFIPLNVYFECNMNGLPHHNNLELDKLIFDEYFIEKPEKVKFVVGAQFIVSKKSIKRRKVEFYKKLLNQFYRDDISNHPIGGNKMPWVMERVWYYIFNEKYRTKYDI